MVKISRDEQVDFLVKRQFPEDLDDDDWAVNFSRLLGPVLVEECPYRAPDMATLKNWVQQETISYRKKLLAMPRHEMSTLFETELAKNNRELEAKSEELDKFYNHPAAAADYEHWDKATTWTIDEAVALLLGKSPEAVTWEIVKRDTQFSKFAKIYARNRDLALRATEAGELSNPVQPSKFLGWAKQFGIDCPAELAGLVNAGNDNSQDWKAEYDELATALEAKDQMIADLTEQLDQLEKQLKTSENKKILSSLYKILIGIAFEQYDYDPARRRNNATEQIVGDLGLHGIEIDKGTVLQRLREAADIYQENHSVA